MNKNIKLIIDEMHNKNTKGVKMSEDDKEQLEQTSGENISEKLSFVVSGEDYIKFTVLRERIVFYKKITQREKNAEIIKIAINLLTTKVDEFVKSGQSFIPASKLE